MREKLLKTFQTPYNREDWQKMLLEVFGARELLSVPQPLEHEDNTAGFELGRLRTSDGYDIGIFEYEIKDGRNIEKGRVKLRNFVKHYLKYFIDAAIVVYHDDKHWRVSFISDLKGEKTNPKRFTYVFGAPDQSYKTPLERFTSLAETKATFANIFEAFSVDKLDAAFFKGYKDLYGVFCKDAPDEKQYRDYIKKMMGRLVFLHFLQKKGWLGGDRNYMNNLLARSRDKYHDTFLSEVLSVLFFDTLNEKREGNTVDPILGEGVKIPYLNGGLFERDALDEQGVDFPFENFERLFDFFSSYNFTVDENAPDDAEVGVDPEMLGHIFENLLEDNKDKGAYYTPKEVVQYMCRESIFEYLKGKADHSLHENIRQTVFQGDVEWLRGHSALPEIVEHLKDVKVCDPAIGSGAFPMGMLNELYNIRRALYDCFATNYTITAYTLKKDIIKNNIYGVDLDQGAVDIARLRFWLALVVDDTEQQPLPNLDYKILQGNSLLESFQNINLSLYFDLNGALLHDKEDKRGLVNAYFGESSHDKKYELRKRIDEEVEDHVNYWCRMRPDFIRALDKIPKTEKPFFLWHVYFQDIFERGGDISKAGFDIMIGNPPYGATSSEYEKRQYLKEYRSSRSYKYQQKGSMDTYTLFIEQAFNKLGRGGVLSFIVPMSVTSGESMLGIHTLLERYCSTIKISSYARHPKPVFDNAMVSVSIMSFVKTHTKCEGIYMTKMYKRRSGVSLEQLLSQHKFIEVGDFILRGRFPKISEQIEKDILTKLFAIKADIGKFMQTKGEPVFYRRVGGGNFEIVTNYSTGATTEMSLHFDKHIRNLIGAILSSSLYHWYYQAYSDDRNFKKYEIESFSLPIEEFSDELIDKISTLYEEYLADIESNVKVRESKTSKNINSFKQYNIGLSKHLIDQLDDLIGPAYGLSAEEIEFIKNYEIEFRMPEVK